MTVATDDGHAGKCEPALGTDDVDDTVLGMHHAEVSYAEVCRVLGQGVDLGTRYGVFDGFVLIVGGGVMVGHAEDAVGAEDA